MLATLAMPLSAFELRDAVRQAQPIDPKRLDRVLRLDASRGLVEVQASASWEGLVARLHPSAPEMAAAWRALPSIAEAIGTNAPGPDGRPVVVHVESLALVTPDGELRRVSRDCHPELFVLAVGGQGLFGVLYSATLRLDSIAAAAAAAEQAERLELPASGAPCERLGLLVPPAALQDFLADARRLCEEWRMPIEGVEVRRAAPEDETLLRWARHEYAAVALELGAGRTLGGRVRATQLRRGLIDIAISHGGSFAIATTRDATRAQAEACYPELRRLLAEKRRIDPAEKLTSEWYRHYRSLLAREACASRWNQVPA